MNGGLPPASPADLVWSPGAQDALVALIVSARHELLIENEEMNDEIVVHALQEAARRGVRVEVVMTRQSDWASAFSALVRAGVAVRTYSASAPFYIHAKAIVVDPGTPHARVFLGSQNFSVASLLYDRELGIVTTEPALIAAVRQSSAATAPAHGLAAVRLSTKPCRWASCSDSFVEHDEDPDRDGPTRVRAIRRRPHAGPTTSSIRPAPARQPGTTTRSAWPSRRRPRRSACPRRRASLPAPVAVPEHAVCDVVMSMNEACKNAIRFSGSERPIDVTVAVEHDDVHVVVRDHGVGFAPAPIDTAVPPDPLEPHGRGLFLMSVSWTTFASPATAEQSCACARRSSAEVSHYASAPETQAYTKVAGPRRSSAGAHSQACRSPTRPVLWPGTLRERAVRGRRAVRSVGAQPHSVDAQGRRVAARRREPWG